MDFLSEPHRQRLPRCSHLCARRSSRRRRRAQQAGSLNQEKACVTHLLNAALNLPCTAPPPPPKQNPVALARQKYRDDVREPVIWHLLPNRGVPQVIAQLKEFAKAEDQNELVFEDPELNHDDTLSFMM